MSNVKDIIQTLRGKGLIDGPAHATTDENEARGYVRAYGSEHYSVVMIDCPWFVAVRPEDAQKLEAAGYEIA